MDTTEAKDLLREILSEVRESRTGIRGLDQIVRRLETDVSGLQANTARLETAFSKHIADYERAREERIAFDKRLGLLESLFNEFLKREAKRDEREEEANKDRRDSKRMFWYFTVGQIIVVLLAVYAVVAK